MEIKCELCMEGGRDERRKGVSMGGMEREGKMGVGNRSWWRRRQSCQQQRRPLGGPFASTD